MDETSSCDSISHYRFISKCKANEEKLKDVLNALLQKESFNEEYAPYSTMRK